MNKLKILTLTTLLALVLTGCGMNAEKLADEMIAAMEGKQLTQATATMTMEMSMEAEGESMDMTIEGMDEMMDAVLADMLGANESGIELDMNVGAIHAVYENMSYDSVDVPAVPEEGLMIANQASFNPDMGDGTYVIQESGDAMKITPPDGWKAVDMGYDTVTLQKDDKKSSVVFTMHTNVESGLQFRNYVERGDVLTLLQEGNYGSHGSSELKSDYSGMWVKAADGTNYYYAWTATGERCFLFVKMTDKGSFDRNKADSVVSFAEEIDLKSLYE